MPQISKRLEEVLKVVRTWPEDRQEEAALLLEQMTEGGVYRLSAEERADIEEGLAEVRRGEFASDSEVAAVFQRHGV